MPITISSVVEFMVKETYHEIDASKEALQINEKSKKQVLHGFLNEVFSDTIAETLLRVLDFHVGRKMGKNLVESILENPIETYEAIYSFFGAAGAVRALEISIAKQVKKKYEIIIDNRLITKLKNGDNRPILATALKIHLIKIGKLYDLINTINNIENE